MQLNNEGGTEGKQHEVCYCNPLTSTKQSKRAKMEQKPNGNLKDLSHTLSWILRHKAIELGLNMTSDGYVQVDELLACQHPRIKRHQYTVDQIRQVVENDNKQRYKIEMKPIFDYRNQSTDCEDSLDDNNLNENRQVLCIRANQGHSISSVNSNLILRLLSPNEVAALPIVVHGTFRDLWENFISIHGLKRMTRNHIHFATGLPKDGSVISGMRKSCDVYIFINTKKCAEDNIQFFRSDNGVILCAGIGDQGILHPKYFSHVTDASGQFLMKSNVD